LRRRLLPQNIAGYLSMLKADADNVSLHDDLAILYSQAGEGRRAAEQFAESLRLHPGPATHYNLANALLRDGRAEEAVRDFEAALQLKPDYALAHQGLALALAARGARAVAIAHLKEAVRLAPSLEDAHYNLGVLLAADGQLVKAAASLEQALALRG